MLYSYRGDFGDFNLRQKTTLDLCFIYLHLTVTLRTSVFSLCKQGKCLIVGSFRMCVKPSVTYAITIVLHYTSSFST